MNASATRVSDSGRFWIRVLLCTVLGVACDASTQSVFLTAEDYRFSPTLVRRSSGRPITLTVSNAGREVHEFASPLLAHARDLSADGRSPGKAAPAVVTLEPGRFVRFMVEAPVGTYLYWCRRKGHHNMSGTLIIE
ncbi:hypothetical protein YTPLAS18_38550 [Nitrospira sp.]|nr:hypothetical protein YTPLAS18_38550 [Nitrospira sp.]